MEQKNYLRSPLRAEFAARDMVLCLRVTLVRSPEIAFIAQASSYDCLYVDLEHGTAALDDTAAICRTALAIGMPALVRVASERDAAIGKLLDAGAGGIIVPHVDNVAQARAVVEACRFAPLGARSFGGPSLRSGYKMLPAVQMMADLNDATIVAVMLETPAAIEAADQIAAVPGIDMLMIGTADLSTAYGVPGQNEHERLQSAYRTAAAACQTHGKILGIGGIGDPQTLARYVAIGARFISAGTDADLLVQAARARTSALAALRSSTSNLIAAGQGGRE